MSQTKHPGGRPRRTDGARQTTIHLSAEAHALAWQYVEDISRAFEPVRSLPNPRPLGRVS